MSRLHGSALALCLGLTSTADAQTISNGRVSVTIDRMGLITRAPPGGLISTYGPRVKLGQNAVEWFGVRYQTSDGIWHEGVGEAALPDWARRTPVQYVSSSATSDGATTVGKVGDLEIEHTFSFDETTGCLVIGVTLRNRGPRSMNMVFYTREWHSTDMETGGFPSDWHEIDLPASPNRLWRLIFMPNNIPPRHSQGCVLALDPGQIVVGPAAVDVPLTRWKGGSWTTNGVDFGTCWGISFTDFDHDGFIDVYSNMSRDLWQNLGGTDWVKVANLSAAYPSPPAVFEYGSGWADYNNDQLPDFGSEPRGGCMALLKNLGGASFDNVGNDTSIVDVQPCNAASETITVADVDGDANLDWFLPTYPPWIGSSGNWFLYNEGLDTTTGEYTFAEQAVPAGLDNPPFPVNRPEGAEFVDYDYDGDVDLYSNNTIYRNLSTPGTALFEAMTEVGSGVVFSDILDEGAKFLDYDMDGDMDLCIAFCDFNRGVRMFENNGDGSFSVQPKTLFDSYNIGLCLGLSCADWDNDGDVDVTSSEIFRRNQFMESGMRHYTVATHSLPSGHITDAVPAWGDFDRDGDLDSALGNWGERGRLYDNITYGPTTTAEERRYVRVKVVRDSDTFDDGLESEYGAEVTVRPIAVDDTARRVRVVSTGGGYLNQDEYALHFALPADPDPTNADVDLSFSVVADLKGSSTQGFARVDRHVNPALASVDLAALDQREIVVYRSGRVIRNGIDYRPAIDARPLWTTTDGLQVPGVNAPIPPLVASPGTDWFVGIEISTANATEPQRLEEIVLDGHLDDEVNCTGVDGDTFVWDVTNPAAPVLAEGGFRDLTTRPRNERSYLGADVVLEPGRVYRVVCRVVDYRATAVAAPITNDVITTNGGLFFQDATPCTGAGAAAATVDAGNVYLAVRFRPEPTGAWADLGHALAGTSGDPVLTGTGTLHEGDPTTIDLVNAAPNAPAVLFVGTSRIDVPLFGGTLVPALDVIIPGFVTDAAGALTINAIWPDDVPVATSVFLQFLIADNVAPRGFSFSNALEGITP